MSEAFVDILRRETHNAVDGLLRRGRAVVADFQDWWRGFKNRLKSDLGRSIRDLLLYIEPVTDDPQQTECARRAAAVDVARRILGERPAYVLRTTSPGRREQMLRELTREVACALKIGTVDLRIEKIDDIYDGEYRDSTRCIVLSIHRLQVQPMSEDDALSLLDTFFHEMYHAFQHQAVRTPESCGISSKQAREWGANFRDYADPELNLRRYRQQPVEVTARVFAHRVVRELM